MTQVTVWKASDLSVQWATQLDVIEDSLPDIKFSSNSARVCVFDVGYYTGAVTFHIWACSGGEVLEPSEEEADFAREDQYKIRENLNEFYVDDGWVYSKKLGCAGLCWLPPSLRRAIVWRKPYAEASLDNYFAFEGTTGSTTLLNLSNFVRLIPEETVRAAVLTSSGSGPLEGWSRS